MKKLLLSATFALLAVNAQADEKTIREQLTKSMPTMQLDTVKPSPIKGVFEVTIGGSMVYVSDDGKYLLQGRLIDTQTKTDLTEDFKHSQVISSTQCLDPMIKLFCL